MLEGECILCEEETCLAACVLCVKLFTFAVQSFIFPDIVEKPEHLLTGARIFPSAKGRRSCDSQHLAASFTQMTVLKLLQKGKYSRTINPNPQMGFDPPKASGL